MSETTPTRSAFLEIREERRSVEEGYRFLDEKRLILAATILRELAGYESARARFEQHYGAAADALRQALARHGLDGLWCQPPAAADNRSLALDRERVLGIDLYRARWEESGGRDGPWPVVDPSPESERCRRQFSALLPEAADLAARAGNLERLRREYVRTARRARALEDVILPEMERALKRMDAALEEVEREETLRLRWLAGGS